MVTQQHEVTWHGQPVVVHEGTPGALRKLLPSFSRQPFGSEGSRNESLQVILREPLGGDGMRIPVAAVSMQYDLVQHQTVLDWLVESLTGLGYAAGSIEMKVMLTRYGERMHLEASLPQFDFDPGDGNPLRLIVHAWNSVDKSTALEISLGWWRQVCGNGLKVLVSGSTARRTHVLGIAGVRMAEVLKAQLEEVPAEYERYQRLLGTPVTMEKIESWADKNVARVWGTHAAARACHIARTGWDGQVKDPFERSLPHAKAVCSERPVPGTSAPVRNAFHAAQILSWLASHRGTVQERFERMADIQGLMSLLLQELRN